MSQNQNPPEELRPLAEYIHQKHREAGVDLNREQVFFLMKMFMSFVKETPVGKHVVLWMLNIAAKPVSILKTYFKNGYDRADENRIRSTDLMEYSGYIYKGVASIAYSKVDVMDKEEAHMCDSCGGRFPADYCIRQAEVLKQSGHTRIETLCNHCRYHSENPKIRDTGSARICAGCEKTACEFHPNHVEAPPILLPPPPREFDRIPDNMPIPPGWSR